MKEFELEVISEVEVSVVGNHRMLCKMASANINWFGEKTEVEVIINDGADTLLGTELLRDSVLRVNYKNRKVTINKKK
ncbi:MAG: hypothetical protein H7Z37_11610 [Pyrinomonadaceae bacterium]|nr:hypothetical protein [Pyrinomonadaceae bacterium]